MKQGMDDKTKARMEARTRILKALAHPSRLFMVDQLAVEEKCVCVLAEMLAIDMSTASKHLTLLKHAGIVQDEKRGSMVFYKLRVPKVMDCIDWVESIIKSTAQEQLNLMH